MLIAATHAGIDDRVFAELLSSAPPDLPPLPSFLRSNSADVKTVTAADTDTKTEAGAAAAYTPSASDGKDTSPSVQSCPASISVRSTPFKPTPFKSTPVQSVGARASAPFVLTRGRFSSVPPVSPVKDKDRPSIGYRGNSWLVKNLGGCG